VQKLAKLGGISTRTLRYYDEVGILKPARINSSGYRIYGQEEVDKLQQILFYKELGVDLDSIKDIITNPAFDRAKALKEHKQKLLERKAQLDLLLDNVDRTLKAMEGVITMKDKEKFEGFKQKLIDDNEEKYGKEIRDKYGDDTINKSNAKVKGMTGEDYEEVTRLGNEVIEVLSKALLTGDPAGELAQKAAELHKQWLSFYWDKYSKEAHAGVAQMYVEDERFREFYDKEQLGTAAFLRDAILIYTGVKQ
jgi:DNA-binding transcriptional MerR regulator